MSSSAIGIDVGSTTVKIAVVDAASRAIVHSDYRRHETRQAETVLELLDLATSTCAAGLLDGALAFVTGSGSRALRAPLAATFVQEVHAVAIAVETLHPDAGSVVELGGQDAKIIRFPRDPRTGERRPVATMNDKCASGTGATIDKCLVRVGLREEEVGAVRFDARRLHKVAAKCGVFAETDIVNLVKLGVPSEEVLCSLGDAIVQQNLSVLARGSVLAPRVVLLGGPNTFLPFLRECWRLRIPETWRDRGIEPPADASIEELITVPENAELYAAYGAALYGLERGSRHRPWAGTEALRQRLATADAEALRPGAGPALLAEGETAAEVTRRLRVPDFVPRRAATNGVVRAAIGVDGGSTSSKAVLIDESGAVLDKVYRLSRGNPIEDLRLLLAELRDRVAADGARLEHLAFGVTGYAADALDECVRADAKVVETIAHARSALDLWPDADVVCDIGGQDIKVLVLRDGDVRDFRLSNQCSAGNGTLLQALAAQLGVPLDDYARHALRARRTPTFGYGCAVFLDSDRVHFQREGWSPEELLAGMARVLPKNVWQYVVQLPRLAALGRVFVLQGGTQRNVAAVKAQVDYLRERVPDADVRVHPHCGEAGAIGAALEALDAVRRSGRSRFVGLEAAVALRHTTRNDESTRCRFCPNLCSRVFVDTETPDGRTSRFISGFSCEKGTVESAEALRALVSRRKDLKRRLPNLVEYEARVTFRSFREPRPLPAAGALVTVVESRRGWLGGLRRRSLRRAFRRSSPAAAERRRKLRIGLPRVLSLYTLAPFFRSYFETLGVPPQGIVFSPETSEELFQDGAKYGSVDPCYPAKVAQSHVHRLLRSECAPAGEGLDWIYFPTVTHLPTFVDPIADSTACPIVAGTPNVIRAAFTKESDLFARHGVEYVDAACNLIEPGYLRRQMLETWGERLGVTEDESDHAVAEGLAALRCLAQELERRGLEILERAESEDRVALLVLARPYHADPGLHHRVLERFQELGYPVLSIRSLPKDAGWLERWFRRDLEQGRMESVFDLRDVWPESYSTNSAQKVWAAKMAARHPNIAVLDLSSFKCGHDAPTYGLIDEILDRAGKPFLKLHDLDATKPTGSLEIRVRTYVHALRRYEERLAERGRRRGELERSVARRRLELLAERRRQLERAHGSDTTRRRESDELELSWARYLAEDEPIHGIRLDDLEGPGATARVSRDDGADVAPLAPSECSLAATLPGLIELPMLASPRCGGDHGPGPCAGGCAP